MMSGRWQLQRIRSLDRGRPRPVHARTFARSQNAQVYVKNGQRESRIKSRGRVPPPFRRRANDIASSVCCDRPPQRPSDRTIGLIVSRWFVVGRVASGRLHVGENKRGKVGLRALVSAAALRGIMAIWFLVVENPRGQERRAAPRACVVFLLRFQRRSASLHAPRLDRVSHGASFIAPGSLVRRRPARSIHHHHQQRPMVPGVHQEHPNMHMKTPEIGRFVSCVELAEPPAPERCLC